MKYEDFPSNHPTMEDYRLLREREYIEIKNRAMFESNFRDSLLRYDIKTFNENYECYSEYLGDKVTNKYKHIIDLNILLINNVNSIKIIKTYKAVYFVFKDKLPFVDNVGFNENVKYLYLTPTDNVYTYDEKIPWNKQKFESMKNRICTHSYIHEGSIYNDLRFIGYMYNSIDIEKYALKHGINIINLTISKLPSINIQTKQISEYVNEVIGKI